MLDEEYLKEVDQSLLSDTLQGEVLQGPEAEEGGEGHITVTELSHHTSILLDMWVKMERRMADEKRKMANKVATRGINFGILIKIPQNVELDLP